MGTLSIIDQQPRSLARDDIEALEDLAAMVERELVAIEMATVDNLTGIANRRGLLITPSAKRMLSFAQLILVRPSGLTSRRVFPAAGRR